MIKLSEAFVVESEFKPIADKHTTHNLDDHQVASELRGVKPHIARGDKTHKDYHKALVKEFNGRKLGSRRKELGGT